MVRLSHVWVLFMNNVQIKQLTLIRTIFISTWYDTLIFKTDFKNVLESSNPKISKQISYQNIIGKYCLFAVMTVIIFEFYTVELLFKLRTNKIQKLSWIHDTIIS